MNARNHPHNRFFFIRCLSLGSPGVHQTQIWLRSKKYGSRWSSHSIVSPSNPIWILHTTIEWDCADQPSLSRGISESHASTEYFAALWLWRQEEHSACHLGWKSVHLLISEKTKGLPGVQMLVHKLPINMFCMLKIWCSFEFRQSQNFGAKIFQGLSNIFNYNSPVDWAKQLWKAS